MEYWEHGVDRLGLNNARHSQGQKSALIYRRYAERAVDIGF